MRYVAVAVLLTLLLLTFPFAIVKAAHAEGSPSASFEDAWRLMWERFHAWAESLSYSMSGAFRSHSTSEM